jgi:hypothetical protein
VACIVDPPVTGAIAVFMITKYLPALILPIGFPLFIHAPIDGVDGTPNFITVVGKPDTVAIIYIYIHYKKI